MADPCPTWPPPAISVLVLLMGGTTPSSRIRVLDFLPELESAGIDVETRVIPKGPIGRLASMLDARRFDAVVIQKKWLSGPSLALLRSRARRLIYDFDDAVWCDEDGDDNRLSDFGKFMEKMDIVVSGSRTLADTLEQAGVKAEVIPSCVDPGIYKPAGHIGGVAPVVVWIGTSGNTRYLDLIIPALTRVHASGVPFSLRVISDKPYQPSTRVDFPVENIPWSLADEPARLAAGSVGVMPLPDNDWTRGKCGYKLLQYMAAGLPCVASAVGANREIVVESETGWTAVTDDDWVLALTQLLSDASLRRRMGGAGRKRVEERYSYKRAAEKWGRIIRGEKIENREQRTED